MACIHSRAGLFRPTAGNMGIAADAFPGLPRIGASHKLRSTEPCAGSVPLRVNPALTPDHPRLAVWLDGTMASHFDNFPQS